MRGLDVEIYDRFSVIYGGIPALLATSRNASQEGVCFILIPSGAHSLTSRPPGASAALLAPPSWASGQAIASSRSKTKLARPANTYHPGFVAMTYHTCDTFLFRTSIFCWREIRKRPKKKECDEWSETETTTATNQITPTGVLRQGKRCPGPCWVELDGCPRRGLHVQHACHST